MGPPKASFVWKYFDKVDADHVVCKLCAKKLRFHSSTTNMKSHLKFKHRHVLAIHEENPDGVIVVDPNIEEHEIHQTTSGDDIYICKMGEDKQTLNYQKLVVPMSMRSVYWKCYGFAASADGEILTRSKIVCLLCKTVISYNRNTSNLRTHLQNKHAEELEQLELTAPPRKPREPKEKKPKATPTKRTGNIYSTNVEGSFVIGGDGSISNTNLSLSQIEEFGNNMHLSQNEDNPQQDAQFKVIYNRGTSKGASRSAAGKSQMALDVPDQNCTIESLHPFMIPIESKTVSDAVLDFIVTDLQLPDVVEGRGFQRLIATLKSPCEIPSKAKLVDEVIPRVYDSLRETVHATLQAVSSDVSLTIEEWDSAAGETYITFSICYQLDSEDILVNKVLSTIHCPSAAVDVSYWTSQFDNVLEEWGIKIEKVKAVICGSCRPELLDSVINKGLIVLPCLVQTLQEVCTRVCFEQDDVRDILIKCRAFIYLVYNTSTALAALRIQDHLMTLEDTPLVSDYPRVWISTYAMLESMLARRQVVPSILDNVEPSTYNRDMVTLSDQEWSLIEDVIAVLEPFKVTIMTLSEEKSPLVSLLKPLLWQLLSCHLRPKEDESMNAQVFKTALKSLLSEKYNEPAINELLQIATALDPRFKNLPNSVEESKSCLDGPIKEALTALIEHTPPNDDIKKPIADESPEKKKPRRSGMLMLLGEMSSPSVPTVMSYEERANLEMVQYQSESTAGLDQCPLVWWRNMANKCPRLALLSRQYTCIPAAAVPPSRIPLETQLAYDVRRANLSPETVHRLVFLNSNHSVG